MPDGVPVEMMSPGWSVMIDEMYAISSAAEKISWRVRDACRRTPFTQPSTARSAASRPTAMQGPSGAKVSNPLHVRVLDARGSAGRAP